MYSKYWYKPCQKEHMQVEFGIDNTLNMSSRKELPDPTGQAVSNRLSATSRGPGIIFDPSIPSKQAGQTTSRLDTRLSNSPAGSPGALHGIHKIGTPTRPAGDVQSEGPALKREIVTMSRWEINTRAPKGKSGNAVVMLPKPRAPGLEITEMTPAKIQRKTKARGKAKGQKQPSRLGNSKLPSDFANKGKIDPTHLLTDGGASFPSKLLGRFKKWKDSCSRIRSAGKEAHRVVRYLYRHQ